MVEHHILWLKGVMILDLFRSYQLIETHDGYDLILFMDTDMNDVEFADEFGRIDEDNKKRLNQNITDYIREKFPNKKINLVKIMAGAVLLSSFFMVAPVTAKAAETPASSITQTQSTYNYNIRVSVNGSLQTFKARPFIYDNTTYVPLYDLGKAIGGSVWWNNSSNTVGINKNDTMIAFMRGSTKARVNGVQKTMPASIVIDDVTYAPVRFIAENLGYKVSLDPSTQIVNISKDTKPAPATNTAPEKNQTATPAPTGNTQWPDVTYIVQPGDTGESISRKFGVPAEDILKYNYMSEDEWFNDGDKIAISGYAPRVTTVHAGQDNAPARRGTAVDWNLEGQYILERGDTFTVTDVDTGKQFKARMIGGYNHADIEPLTASDTTVMKSLFGTWNWSPRAVVIYHDGMNIATSLSGMPHGVDTIDNGVNGHFDLYMKNSTSHSATTSKVYIQQHQNMVMKAAGR